MQTFDAGLEIALLVLFVGICGYAVRLMYTTIRGDEQARAAAAAARAAAAPEPAVVDAHRTVEALIEAVAAPGDPDVVMALQRLTQALHEEPALAPDRRAELAEVLEDLSDAAGRPADERRSGRIHAEVELLGRVATTAPAFGRAWTTWGPVISGRLLPRA
jgi:hypothetical protein